MSGHKKIKDEVSKATCDSQKASSKVNLESERITPKINEEEVFPMGQRFHYAKQRSQRFYYAKQGI